MIVVKKLNGLISLIIFAITFWGFGPDPGADDTGFVDHEDFRGSSAVPIGENDKTMKFTVWHQADDDDIAMFEHRIVRVSTTQELANYLPMVQQGETIVLADGVYEGHQTLSISNKDGSNEYPIKIVAETPGQVIIGDRQHFEVRTSSFVTIEGLTFTSSGTRSAIQLIDTNHSRVTRNHFALTETYGSDVARTWVRVRGGEHNRIDHNLFENKGQRGNYVSINHLGDLDNVAFYTRIDHNHFRNMAPLGGNGMEPIVISAGGYRLRPDIDANTIVEYNLFERADGEMAEIISLKSNGNIIRHNTMVETAGSITFRQGHRNSVYGNYFIGNNKPGTGGVRIYGDDQRIYNNYFYQLANPAVIIGDGNVDQAYQGVDVPAGYVRVKRTEIAFNSFIDNPTSIAQQKRSGHQFLPVDTIIANNLIRSAAPAIELCLLQQHETKIHWEGNLIDSGGHSPNQHSLNCLCHCPEKVSFNDAQLVSGINGIYFSDEGSAAIDAAARSFDYVLTDIEGKQRDERPDIGAFEYVGLPLLRGPLTPDEVGPYAAEDFTSFSPDASGLYITDFRISSPMSEVTGGRWGPITFHADGLIVGEIDGDVQLLLFIDDVQTYEGLGQSAYVTIDADELDEGVHHAKVVLRGGPLQDHYETSFIVENLEILSPNGQESVYGDWPIYLDVRLPEDMVKNVRVLVNGELIFSAPKVTGDLTIDTRSLEDGEHVIEVEVEQLNGMVSRTRNRFTVENYWQLSDRLLPPLKFFGDYIDRTLTFDRSGGWEHKTDASLHYFGDTDRIARIENSREFLVWEAPRLVRAVVTLYSQSRDFHLESIVLATGEDGTNFFEEIDYKVGVEESDMGSYKLTLETDILDPDRVKYFRLLIEEGNAVADHLEVGHVTLVGEN